tara:strand:+ start:275 stop:406 length:132 start_codon:yes stop_codon:yes gene_type:complete
MSKDNIIIPSKETIKKVLKQENSDEFDVGYYLGFKEGEKNGKV